MFDTMLPDLDELAGADDTVVVAAIAGWARIEAAAAARRLAAIAELVARRIDGPEYSRWACDDWDATAAEVGAALHVSHGKASAQMYLAAALPPTTRTSPNATNHHRSSGRTLPDHPIRVAASVPPSS